MSHTITIGPAIRAIRRAQGLQVQELAARAGVSGAYLTNVEKSVKRPALDTALRIAHALNVPSEAITVTCTECETTTKAVA